MPGTRDTPFCDFALFVLNDPVEQPVAVRESKQIVYEMANKTFSFRRKTPH